ncbi:hypothetical protein [Holophaga foetida]|uniref:hypothetical protein n=1 Tax=Holophaga foetida TaxID=35839 RepID=UPI0002473F5C|nr:hypothetical protein [Holophaga foetida]
MTTKYQRGLAKHESGVFYYCFRINGQQFKGSTRATDLTTARKVLEEKKRIVLQEECGIKRIPTLAEVRDQWLKVHKAVYK